MFLRAPRREPEPGVPGFFRIFGGFLVGFSSALHASRGFIRRPCSSVGWSRVFRVLRVCLKKGGVEAVGVLQWV